MSADQITAIRTDSDRGLLYASIAIGVLSALVCVALAVAAWTAAPGLVRIFLPGKYGSVELGSLPALPVFVVDVLMAATAIAWTVFVAVVWPRRRLARAVIPIVAYLLGIGTIVGFVIAQDPSNGEVILTAFFVAAMWGGLVTLFAIGLAANPRARRRR